MKIPDIKSLTTPGVERANSTREIKTNESPSTGMAAQEGQVSAPSTSASEVDVAAVAELRELSALVSGAEVRDVEFADLKAAISEGRVEVDLEGLAERLLGYGEIPAS